MLRVYAHEVDVGLVGGPTDDTHEKRDELPVLLDGEARLGEVPEEEAWQLVRNPSSAPPGVGDGHHGAVIRLL